MASNWRDRVANHSQPSIATSSPLKVPLNAGPRVKARPAVKKASNQVTDVGFTDQDVAVQLADAKALRNNPATRTSQSMVIVVDDDDYYEPTDVDLPGEPVNESKLPPSKRRSPVAPTDERKSRSVGSLPFWAQAKWDLVFVPTLLDLAGRYDAEDGGWEIEKNKDMFVLLLQDVADIVYPNVSYAVHPTSNMYHLSAQLPSQKSRGPPYL